MPIHKYMHACVYIYIHCELGNNISQTTPAWGAAVTVFDVLTTVNPVNMHKEMLGPTY